MKIGERIYNCKSNNFTNIKNILIITEDGYFIDKNECYKILPWYEDNCYSQEKRYKVNIDLYNGTTVSFMIKSIEEFQERVNKIANEGYYHTIDEGIIYYPFHTIAKIKLEI